MKEKCNILNYIFSNFCRCRHGYFHIVNNFYAGWEMYAIGGSANPTINSQGNVFIANDDNSTKEVSFPAKLQPSLVTVI